MTKSITGQLAKPFLHISDFYVIYWEWELYPRNWPQCLKIYQVNVVYNIDENILTVWLLSYHVMSSMRASLHHTNSGWVLLPIPTYIILSFCQVNDRIFINKNVPNHILVPQPATVMSELGPNFKILPATDQIRELQTIIR